MSDRVDVGVPDTIKFPIEEIEKMKADLATAHVAIATARFRLERIGRASLWCSNFTDADLTDAQAALTTLMTVKLDHRLLAQI